MNATVQSIPASTCVHRQIVFDAGTLRLVISEITDARPETFAELKEQALIIIKHQYLTRRASGRTAAQAMNDLIGFTVRI